ncbi:hypothetical protein C8Q79DRAFT_539437 [Trametes meyenii]|nr:hypothetical protein C8Q79DRAFT_539437 [Trametes meyenii]
MGVLQSVCLLHTRPPGRVGGPSCASSDDEAQEKSTESRPGPSTATPHLVRTSLENLPAASQSLANPPAQSILARDVQQSSPLEPIIDASTLHEQRVRRVHRPDRGPVCPPNKVFRTQSTIQDAFPPCDSLPGSALCNVETRNSRSAAHPTRSRLASRAHFHSGIPHHRLHARLPRRPFTRCCASMSPCPSSASSSGPRSHSALLLSSRIPSLFRPRGAQSPEPHRPHPQTHSPPAPNAQPIASPRDPLPNASCTLADEKMTPSRLQTTLRLAHPLL